MSTSLNSGEIIPAALGAGSKGLVSGFLGGIGDIGGLGITDDILTGVIGFLMASNMDGFGGDFGMGLLLASLGGITEPIIGGILPGGASPALKGRGGALSPAQIEAMMAGNTGAVGSKSSSVVARAQQLVAA